MDDSAFDPYRQWLGVDGDAGPPNHYRLLGLEPLEDDQAKIRRVSKARYLSIKLLEPDHHRSEWKQLLSAMREAGKCLTDPEKKAAYDRELAHEALKNQAASPPPSATLVRGADGDHSIPTTVPLASSLGPTNPAVQAAPSSQVGQPADRSSQRSVPDAPLEHPAELGINPQATSVAAQHRQRRKKTLRSALPTVIILLLIGGVCWALRERIETLLAGGASDEERPAPSKVPSPTPNPPIRERRKRPADAPPDPFANFMTDQQDAPADDGGGRSNKSEANDGDPSDETNVFDDTPAPQDNKTDSPLAGAETAGAEPTRDDPAGGPALTLSGADDQSAAPPTLTQVLSPAATLDQLLADAFLAMRNRHFDEARQILDQAQQLPLEKIGREPLASMLALSQAVDQFWKTVRSSMTQMPSGQELEVGETRVLVVESKPERIVIRLLGENRRYSIDDLPAGLAEAIAAQLLKKDTAESQVFLGAFHLVDRPGDPETARRLWNQAAASGADVKDLLPLLDFNPQEPPSNPQQPSPDAAVD